MPEQAGLTDAALHVGEPWEMITGLGRGSGPEAGSRALLDSSPSPHPIHPLSTRSSSSPSSPPVQHLRKFGMCSVKEMLKGMCPLSAQSRNGRGATQCLNGFGRTLGSLGS